MLWKKPPPSDSMTVATVESTDSQHIEEDANTAISENVKHLVFCVHGINSNPKEVQYLKNAMQEVYGEDNNGEVRYICDDSNTGNTYDGYEVGGQRLAKTIQREIDALPRDKTVYLSLIGYSLGGIFCRSALRYVDMAGVTPLLFCTIASPNVGLANQTVFPRWFEKTAAKTMRATGQDLNMQSEMVHDMATSEAYLAPLRQFKQRVAVANAFHTDVVVPPASAAFLSLESTYPHTVIRDNRKEDISAYLMTVKTRAQHDAFGVTQSLDALGWTKIFLDLRDAMPGPSLPRVRTKSPVVIPKQANEFSSKDLHTLMSKKGTHWKVPLAHPTAIANPKHALYRKLISPRGAPFVDQLAEDLVYILQTEGKSRFEQDESPRVRAMTKRFSQILLDDWYKKMNLLEEEEETATAASLREVPTTPMSSTSPAAFLHSM